MMNPRLLFIGPLPDGQRCGGTQIAAAQLLSGLAARGYGVHALSPAPAGADGSCRPAVPVPGVTITPYPMSGDLHDISSAPTLEEQQRQVHGALPSVLRAASPDAVLIGHPGWIDGVPAVARAYGLPCLLWVHSALQVDGSRLLRYPECYAAQIRAQIDEVDLVVTVAEHLRVSLETMGVSRLVAVRNGVDTARFRSRPRDAALASALGLADDDVVVLHASTLRPVKRGMALIEAAARALARDRRLVFVIMGEGPDSQDMQRASHERGIAGRCRFLGWVDHARMPDYLSLADMVVMPSAMEGMALAYLEAQAAGTVLIASDIDAAREVIAPGETGLLYRPGDANALADAIVRVAGDRGLRRRIGRHARDWARRHCDVAGSIDAFAIVIEGVVSDTGRRREHQSPGERA